MVAGWLIRWCVFEYLCITMCLFLCRIPMYWYLKTFFLFYLALPQTQGATNLYNARLQPLLAYYEPQIDASMARLRSRAYDFVRAKIHELWNRIISAPPPSPSGNPPTMQDAPLQYASGFLRTYSPFLLGAAGAMMQPAPAPTDVSTGSAARRSRSRSSSASSTSSFAATDINLTSKAQPAIEPRSSAGVRVRTRTQPRTSEPMSRPMPKTAPATTKQRDDIDETFHSDVSDSLLSPDGDGPAAGYASKASSAYEKLKAD